MTRPNFRSTHTVFLAVLLGLCNAPAYGESLTIAQPAVPPQDTVIEQNWLGIAPQGTEPAVRSAFGVPVFNGVESQIRSNLKKIWADTEVSSDWVGNGHNPSRDTTNRRLDTGNGAINTPEFLSNMFYLDGNVVNLDGKADPGAVVDVYKVTEGGGDYGPLNEKLLSVQADEQGRFSVTLEGLKTSNQVGAISTHPNYGTSEPALNALVQSLN